MDVSKQVLVLIDNASTIKR